MIAEPSASSLEMAAEALRLTEKHIEKLPGWLGYLPGLREKLRSVADWLQEKADAKFSEEPTEEEFKAICKMLEEPSAVAQFIASSIDSRPKRQG